MICSAFLTVAMRWVTISNVLEPGMFLERLSQRRIGFEIQCREAVVKDIDGRFLDQGPRDREPLFLATRNVHTALSDFRLHPFRFGRDELRGLGNIRRQLQILVAGVLVGISEVACNRPGE